MIFVPVLAKKILIFGASGYVGQNLFTRVDPDRTVATYFQRPFPGGTFFDFSQTSIAELIQGRGEFSHALILLGSTRLDRCASDIKTSKKINIITIIALIDELFDLGIKPIFTSSDMVFDGTQGDLSEDVNPNPVVTYGKQKVAVEQHLINSGKPFSIIRLSKIYGKNLGDQTLFTQMLDSLAAGGKITVAQDHKFCPIFIDDVVEGLLATVSQDLSGIFHLCGPDACTWVDVFQILKNALEVRFKTVNRYNVQYCNINDFDFLEKRPIDCSMVPHKFTQATGLQLQTVESVCQSLVETLQKWPPS